MKSGKASSFIREEWFLGFSLFTCLAFLLHGEHLFARLSNPFWMGFVFLWLFAAILGSALCVVRHADHLAVRLGEPYGTLILTLAVTSIEIMAISAVMMQGAHDPTLVRDTLFAVVMMILNGMVGLSLLIGAWRHREQHYNLQGANAYLGVIIPLAVLSLILPNYTQTTRGPVLSMPQEAFLTFVSVGLYGTFLAIQTGRHRGYFTLGEEDGPDKGSRAKATPRLIRVHAALLAAYMIPVVFLAEQLAHPIRYLIENLEAPRGLAGAIIALLVATPEAIGAVRAANVNHLQRSMNIFLGSVLSTIGLTIPVMLVVSNVAGRRIILGLQNSDSTMLLLTLAVSVVTFASGRTTVLQGAVHLILFGAYFLLLFQG